MDTINQDLDKIIDDEMTAPGANSKNGGSRQPAAGTNTGTKGKKGLAVQREVAKPEKTKGKSKFKWKNNFGSCNKETNCIKFCNTVIVIGSIPVVS